MVSNQAHILAATRANGQPSDHRTRLSTNGPSERPPFAGIGSVLARLPSAWAKARTWAGSTTTIGSPALARPAATTASKPPVASIATSFGDKALSRATRSSIPEAVRLKTKTLASRTNRNVQPVLRYVDPKHYRVHLIPSLRKRASIAAQATVRVRWGEVLSLLENLAGVHPR